MSKLTTTVLDHLYNFTSPFEGSIPHMYKDTANLVTCGVGFMLPNLASAQAMGFVPADKVAQDFAAVSAAPPARVAAFYKQFTVCTLPIAGLRAEFDRRVNDFATTLASGYDLLNYPESVQVAILDMCYNLGAGALLNKWPSFKAACQHHDWKTASTQCTRKGIGNSRNLATAALFLKA